jgi:membrane protein
MEDRKKYVNKSVFKHLYDKIQGDEVTGLAAQLAYYFLLSIFPLLIFVITLLPFLQVSQADLMELLHTYAPAESANLLESSLKDVMANQNGGLLSFGILATMWSASNGTNAIIRALNHAYDVEETRSFIKTRGLALILTIGLILVVVVSLLLPVFGKYILKIVFDFLGYEPSFVYDLLRWVISIAVITFVFLILYWIGPNLKMKCRDVLPGAIFASVGWALSSWAFSIYVSTFGNYSSTYGSLGGLIVLMLWLYISGLVIIVGGEINAVLSRNKRNWTVK